MFQRFKEGNFTISVRQQIFIFSFLINLLFIPLGLASPNEGSRYLLIKTISENNSLSWPSNWANSYGGFWFFPDFGINNGFVSDKAPGLSLLLVPFYLVAKTIFLLLVGPTVTTANIYTNYDNFVIYMLKLALIVLASYTMVRMFDLLNLLSPRRNQNVLIAGIACLGTLFLLYIPTFFPSLVSAFLYISIIYHLIQYDRFQKNSDLIIAGIFAGFSVVVEYGSLLMIPWFIGYILSKDLLLNHKINLKGLLILVITIIFGMIPLFLYNFAISGNPLQTSYYFSHWVSQINFFHNLVYGISLLLFDYNKGLFIFNPILFLGCIGFLHPDYYKKNIREILLIVVPSLVFIIFYAKNFDPTGGAAVGPRYIIAIIPLLAIGLQGWFLIANRFSFFLNSVFSFISFRNTILAVLNVGVYPGSDQLNPIATQAVPRFINNQFHPILLQTDQPLFVALALAIILTLSLINYDKLYNLFTYLFSSHTIRSEERNVVESVERSSTSVILSDKQRNQLIFSTLWLMIVFLAVFLTFGIQYLSKEYYAVIPPNNISDRAVILLLIIIASLATLRKYTSFSFKQFIKGE